MLFFIMVGGLGVPAVLALLITRLNLREERQSALFWLLWTPAAIGGAWAGSLAWRALGYS